MSGKAPDEPPPAAATTKTRGRVSRGGSPE
jgi:hypothetical protein